MAWADLSAEVAAEFGELDEGSADEVMQGLESRLYRFRAVNAQRMKDWRARRRLADPQGHAEELERNRAHFQKWAWLTGRLAPPKEKKRKCKRRIRPTKQQETRNVLAQRMAARKGARKAKVSK